MELRKFLPAAAAGFAAGYALMRICDAFKQDAPAAQAGKARTYGRMQRAYALGSVFRSLAGSAIAAYGPLPEKMDRAVSTWPLPLAVTAYVALFAVVGEIADAPVAFVEDYKLEKRYGLSTQDRQNWIEDRLKALALETLLLSAIGSAFLWVVRRWPKRWPLIASAALFPLLVAANVVIPLYILPLFNTYRAIEGDLEKRLRALAARFGVGDADLLRFDMSRRTKKANAFVIGVGKTHRIAVADTLIEHFDPEEIEFIVSHELGHYVAKDSWRMIAAAQFATMAGLFTAAAAIKNSSGPVPPSAVARISFWIGLTAQSLRPLLSAFARSREWAADRFALAATRSPQWGVAAFTKLRDQNLAEEEQPAWFEFLFSTHPSIRARIAALT